MPECPPTLLNHASTRKTSLMQCKFHLIAETDVKTTTLNSRSALWCNTKLKAPFPGRALAASTVVTTLTTGTGAVKLEWLRMVFKLATCAEPIKYNKPIYLNRLAS